MTEARSSIVWTEKNSLAPDLLGLGDSEFRAELASRFGDFLGALEVTGPRWSYPIALTHANRYTGARLALAGDAAHVNNPVGGMGMNSGIHDGLNLAAKLIAIWRGEAGEDQLERYDRQRRPVAEKYVQAQSIRNKQMLGERDPVIRRQRFDELRRTAEDPALAREYLRRSSLIAMLEEADAIQ